MIWHTKPQDDNIIMCNPPNVHQEEDDSTVAMHMSQEDYSLSDEMCKMWEEQPLPEGQQESHISTA